MKEGKTALALLVGVIAAVTVCSAVGETHNTVRQPLRTESHEPIRAPLHYWETSFPSLAKNSYAQIQEWSDLYLHPGVDLFEDPGTEVYAVADGIVRAILTTGDEQYWRIAIESFAHPGEGYLYAHLDPNSFFVEVGDTVAAGEVIGVLFPAYSFSPHCHFARISPVGSEWNGQWWTVDNPLVDITNMVDTLPPVFENAYGNDLFAFRTRSGEYLDPMRLSGDVEIICKAVDYAASLDFLSRIVPYDLKFRIHPLVNPDSVIYERYSFALDMPLDTYFDTTYYSLVLNTIYARDGTCFSTNNNQNRDFFFILSRSDGDSVITAADSLQVFDTTELPNGDYLLEVIVRDCALHETSGYMTFSIANSTPVAEEMKPDVVGRTAVFRTPYPNPFNSETVLSLQLPGQAKVRLDLFDLGGRKIRAIYDGIKPAGDVRFRCRAADLAAGIYFYRFRVADVSGDVYQGGGKLLLVK